MGGCVKRRSARTKEEENEKEQTEKKVERRVHSCAVLRRINRVIKRFETSLPAFGGVPLRRAISFSFN